MSERPSGRYEVSVADVHLPPLRARVFYPTTNSTASALQAPWLAPSNEFPHEVVTNALRYARVPLARVLGAPLHTVASRTLPASYGAPLLSSETVSKLAVHIFSHGLAGATGGYNHVCMEIASHGGIVFAPEHSDGSAFMAKVDGERVEYARYNPLSHGPSELEFRQNQLRTRVADLEQTLRNIQSANRGDIALQALEGAPKAPSLSGRLDLNNVHVCGHSFGGATALAFARSTKVNSVICLDAWMRSLTREVTDIDVGHAKLLFVDQGLSNMRDSISARERLPRMSGGGTCDAVVIEGASHNNSSDFALRLPRWVALASGMTKRDSDPLQLLERQALVVKEFLNGDWRAFRERVRDGEVVGIGIAPLGRARLIAAADA
ncbi:Platelet-activating factor acetylhydrolase isoform 2 [Gracilaria domingensis]|nr:Platelet-activating factor acetylhydrolase isoform 2 [Gracilaria domingensis]